ncbi:putative response regulator and transcription factor RR-A-type family [Helianthus annuus]|nr:putative response regulator and transcription factor RR-A-type family [Helianthus annuus]
MISWNWMKLCIEKSIKVMLVENDDCTRHIVTTLLRNCNYEVIEAANGLQAWKILENLSVHIDIV